MLRWSSVCTWRWDYEWHDVCPMCVDSSMCLCISLSVVYCTAPLWWWYMWFCDRVGKWRGHFDKVVIAVAYQALTRCQAQAKSFTPLSHLSSSSSQRGVADCISQIATAIFSIPTYSSDNEVLMFFPLSDEAYVPSPWNLVELCDCLIEDSGRDTM